MRSAVVVLIMVGCVALVVVVKLVGCVGCGCIGVLQLRLPMRVVKSLVVLDRLVVAFVVLLLLLCWYCWRRRCLWVLHLKS